MTTPPVVASATLITCGNQQELFPGPPSENEYPGPPSRLPSGDNIGNGEETNGGGKVGSTLTAAAMAIRSKSVLSDGLGPSNMMSHESFLDEPKDRKDAIVGEAAFVIDDGEGNASLMKPRKPVLHMGAQQGDNEFFEGDCLDDDDDDDTVTQYSNSKYRILSNSIFVFSSLLYVGMACMIMDYYHFYKDVPRDVMNADDDAAWWNYFMNCTDDGFMPENVTNADDDNTWMEWYNETAFMDDDNVWLPKIADESLSDGYEPYVSKYMLLYFWAAFGFLVTGVIEIVLARKYFWYRMLYYIMALAAAFGMVSAILTNKDPLWSNICNCISCNLWAIEAIIILVQRIRGHSESEDYEKFEGICGMSIRKWFWVADVSFLIGTVGDSVTSYFYIFGIDNWKLGYSAVVFAMGWLICSFVYLAISVYDHLQYKKYFQELKEEEEIGGRELADIPLTIHGKNANGTHGNGGGFDSDNDNDTNTSSMKKRCTLNTEPSDNDDFSSPPQSSNNSDNGGPPLLEEGGIANEEEKKDDGTGAGEKKNGSPFDRSEIANYLFPKGHPGETKKENNDSTAGTTSVVVPGAIPDNIDIARSSPKNNNSPFDLGLGLMCGGSLPINDDDDAAPDIVVPAVNYPATYSTNMTKDELTTMKNEE